MKSWDYRKNIKAIESLTNALILEGG